MGNKLSTNFLRNAQSISGFGSTVIGFCFALSGIYEFYSHEKLLKNADLHLPTPIESFIKNIDDLPVNQKTCFAAPLLLFGSLIGRSVRSRKFEL